jgi:hypothetical protein
VSELKVVVADQSDLSWAEDDATKIPTHHELSIILASLEYGADNHDDE